jgi:hypothetical protein
MNQNNNNNLPSPIPHINNNAPLIPAHPALVNQAYQQGNPFNPGGLHVIIPGMNNNQMPNENDSFWQPVHVAQPLVYNNLPNIGNQNVPRGTTNLISTDTIEENDEMVNFHGEKALGRFYKKSTFNSLNHNQLSGRKKNPFTRTPIEIANVQTYRAHLIGGKKSKRRKHKKSSKTKKQGRLNTKK